jgi:hypothetical protein
MNQTLYENALAAIMALYEDMTVSREEARCGLNALVLEIEVLIETLEETA